MASNARLTPRVLSALTLPALPLTLRPLPPRHPLPQGVGYSVLDMLKAFSKACGKELQHKMADRRPGDVAVVYGSPDKAKAELGWVAELGLEDMCADSWRWISNNPNGFNDAPTVS